MLTVVHPVARSLPQHADRSVDGLVRYLVSRIVVGEASPYAGARKGSGAALMTDTDEEEEYETYDDELFGILAPSAQSPAMVAALRA